MNNNIMSFCGYVWKNNPSNIKIEYPKKYNEDIIPYNKSVLQDVSLKRRIISGSGEFFGDDCFEQFKALHILLEKKKSGILSIPNIDQIFAKICSLEITAENINNLIEYKFVFLEDYPNNSQYIPKTVIAQNECLWDIANKLDINIDKLVILNPSVKRPDLKLNNKEVKVL